MRKSFSAIVLLASVSLFSCQSGDEKTEKKEEVKDSVTTDEADLPAVDEVEMEYMYEVTYSKTKKVVMMSQEEYLESGIWENPDVVIKEIPVVK